MSLRPTLSAVAGGFLRAMTEGERPMERAATAAVREAAEMAKSAGRANIATAGFSRKCQLARQLRTARRYGPDGLAKPGRSLGCQRYSVPIPTRQLGH